MPRRLERFDPRQTMRNKTFEIFYNYNTSLKTVEVHHHDFYEIYYFIGGDVEYRVEGASYTLKKGDLLLICPWELHQVIVRHGLPYERIVVWIDRAFLSQFISDGADLSNCFDLAESRLIRPREEQKEKVYNLLESMIKESEQQYWGKNSLLHGLFLQFMVELNRISLHPKAEDPEDGEDDLIGRVLAYIADNYRSKITLQEIADHFYVNKYYLSHAFSQRVGTGIYHYIVLKRLLLAKELISSGYPPGEVYQQCGFRDYANFYRAFRAQYGISPKDFALSSDEKRND